ncbi:hypothetical protein SORBI_3008G183150 [Sorghum bicolor]|uniref:Uncharacterized protein n=1 Tax=Sorghum bicolor TaxID=4558 RepID=A0A1Z5R8D0_SORBI|nr:hypothetical protein SORBI_3008G183150 [Sorghum bicolor]
MKNPVFHGKSKHIDLKYHFIRECIERGQIIVKRLMEDHPGYAFQSFGTDQAKVHYSQANTCVDVLYLGRWQSQDSVEEAEVDRRQRCKVTGGKESSVSALTNKSHNAETLFATSGAWALGTSPTTVASVSDNPSQPSSRSRLTFPASIATLFSHHSAVPTIPSHRHLRTHQTAQHIHHQKPGNTCLARLPTAHRWAVSPLPSFPCAVNTRLQRHPYCAMSVTRMTTSRGHGDTKNDVVRGHQYAAPLTSW